MKETYLYNETDLVRTPYLSLFLKQYNNKYTNSYALSQRTQKENKVVDLEQKEIIIFYNPTLCTRENISTQVNTIRREILENLSFLLDQSELTLATENDLLEHSKSSSHKAE